MEIELNPNWKKIAINMSGGADSSMLAYLIAKQIKENDLALIIQPITWERFYPSNSPKNWNLRYAANAIEKIKELLEFNPFEKQYIYKPVKKHKLEDWDEIIEDMKDIESIIFNHLNCDWFFYGTTCNPPLEEMKKIGFDIGRQEERDQNADKSGFKQTNPFCDINKKDLRDLYIKHDVLKSLFPITRSCEGSAEWTDDFTKDCGGCWWCYERWWAFGVPDEIKSVAKSKLQRSIEEVNKAKAALEKSIGSEEEAINNVKKSKKLLDSTIAKIATLKKKYEEYMEKHEENKIEYSKNVEKGLDYYNNAKKNKEISLKYVEKMNDYYNKKKQYLDWLGKFDD